MMATGKVLMAGPPVIGRIKGTSVVRHIPSKAHDG